MDRHAIAAVLDEIGVLLELLGEDRFRARAFRSAARAVEGVQEDVAVLALSGRLGAVRGIGPGTAAVVRELLETGASRLHEELRARTPPSLFALLAIPGLGARRVHLLHAGLGITTIEELERAAVRGRVSRLAGFGKKIEAQILEGIGFLREVAGRRRQPEAFEAAGQVTGFLGSVAGVERIALAGELQRRLETVAGIDVVVATGAAAPVIEAFRGIPGVVPAAERTRDGRASARLPDGFEVRLLCVPPEEFGAACVHATGSPAHVAALAARARALGLRLDRHGVGRGRRRVDAPDEEAVYRALELQYVPPELREGRGEVEEAAEGRLPRLVAYEDLRGTFHCHTVHSDGRATVAEMAQAARERGWRYLGIADHSPAASYAGGLSAADVERQHREIDDWNREHGAELWLFKGTEADILPDGRLDYDDAGDAVLDRFDYVVGSVHSSFELTEQEMTRRVLRAMENPHLTFLGHPTGRLLLARRPYRIDVEAVIAGAAERGVDIEINADPQRLDLDWRHWPAARARGVRTAINPDAHSTAGLASVVYGVHVARKGGLTPDDVVNCWELERVREHFERGRTR